MDEDSEQGHHWSPGLLALRHPAQQAGLSGSHCQVSANMSAVLLSFTATNDKHAHGAPFPATHHKHTHSTPYHGI